MPSSRAHGRLDLARLLALAAAVALGVFFWESQLLFPLKLLAVLLHEAGHALAAKGVGGSVVSVSVDSLEGGLCVFRHEPTLLKTVVTGSAGYLGNAIAGGAMLFVTLRLRSGRLVLTGLAVLVAAVLVLWARTPFTVAVCAGLAICLGVLARFLSQPASQAVAFFVAVFCSLYALFDLLDDLWGADRRSRSDAGLLSEATGIPSIVWAALWTGVAVGLVALALWRGMRSTRARA